MTPLSNDFRLFGVDLRTGVQGLSSLLSQLLQGPPFNRLVSPACVRLLRADGTEQTWRGGQMVLADAAAGAVAPRFTAVEIPDAIVLHHASVLPVMARGQIEDALRLEVQGVNPFAQDKLVWGWRLRDGTAQGGRVQTDAALASLPHVERELQAAAAAAGVSPAVLEAWVFPPAGGAAGAPIVLQGFGEGARLHDARSRQTRAYGFVLLSALLLGAIALTPTAQLLLRAREAVATFDGVQQRAKPVVALREKFVRSSERLKALEAAVAESAAPLQVLDLLTRVLRDDTYVQTLQIDGTKVGVSGLTDNAADVMSRMAAAPGVVALKATQAATRQPGATKESFGLEFQLQLQGMPVRSTAAVATNPAGAEALPAASVGAAVLAPADPGAASIYPRGPTLQPVMPVGPPAASTYSKLQSAEQQPAPVSAPPAAAPGQTPAASAAPVATIGGSAPRPPPAPAPAP